MTNNTHLEQIIFNGRHYDLVDLTEFGFGAELQLSDGEKTGAGTLVLEDERFDVDFRVRSEADGVSSCTFIAIPISSTEKIRKHIKRRSRRSGGLDERSYDELASGVISNVSAIDGPTAETQQKGYIKSFAVLALLFAMVGLVVLSTVFLRSRSSLAVSNAALVGNCIPINAKVEGEIAEVFFSAGDQVRKGDVLLRLSNPEIDSENQQLAAAMATANSKVSALKKQRDLFTAKLEFASKKLELEKEVAISELDAAMNSRASAKAAYERLAPFVQDGAVTQLELDEVESMFRAHEANCIAKENLIKQIDFSKDAASKNLLIFGDRLDDELGKIEADLEIAQAEAKELKQVYTWALQRQKELEVVAPRDGLIYVNYRQKGEFIKVADELVGLSYPGETWAAGQVTSGQASRVIPGQPVSIRIPAIKCNLDGIVMAVGHRAMYSKGHYNADFRGANATDVPVKVYIENLPEDIPSGIRLQMAINTGFGVQWLDNSMGYELKTIGSKKKADNGMDPAREPSAVTLASLPESQEE